MTPPERGPDQPQQSNLEMAYVLFMDIVGYSRMPTDVQQETLRRLQSCVRDGSEFRKAQTQQRLISLPTGDGMALAFFGDPESSVRCAVETTQALKQEKDIPLRMGLHAGPVYRVSDINANQNVAGDGINIAQRVMDCGDAGHILVSKAQADVLRQLSGWINALRDLGEVSVKHGVRVHVFSLVVDGAGNSQLPVKLGGEQETGRENKEVPSKWKRWVLVTAGVLVLASVTAWMLRPVYASPPKVAILGFADQQNNPENDWVSDSLAEDLTSELQDSQRMVTVPGETVSNMKRDLSLSKEISYGPATLEKVRGYAGCDYVIYGSFSDMGKQAGGHVQVNARIQNTKTGEVWSLPVEQGSELTLRELAGALGTGVLGKLGLPNPGAPQLREGDTEMPASPEAAKFYAKGLASLWKYDLPGATQNFEEAIKAEPTFPLAHVELAEAWSRQGYDEKAKQEASEAKQLSTHLGQESKLRVEAAFQEMSADWEEAADSYKALWRFVRGRPEYAYRAADVQIRGGHAEAALVTLAALRKEPGEMRNSPILDLREAEAYEELGRFKEETVAAGRTLEKAHSLGARTLEAEALWRLCGAKVGLGEFAAAVTDCDRSDRFALDVNYPLISARAKAVLGIAIKGQGNITEALAAEQKALQIAKDVGSQRDVIGALQNMGIVYAEQGEHDKAAASFREALRVAEEIRNKTAMLQNYNNAATEYQAQGQLQTALDYYGKCLDLARETKYKSGEADARNNIASVQFLQGRLKESEQSANDGLQLAKDNSFKDKIPSLLMTLGDAQLDQGQIEEARKNYGEALSASVALGDPASESGAEISLSKLQFESSAFSESEGSARKGLEEAKQKGLSDLASSARAALADALTGQGRLGEAKEVLDSNRDAKLGDKGIELSLARASIRLLAKSGQAKKAFELDQKSSADAKRMGLVGWQLRLDLLAGELGLAGQTGKPNIPSIRKVQVAAGKSGYGLIERQASALLRQTAK